MDRNDAFVEARGVCYRYPKTTADAIRDVDLEVRYGEIFALLGPSGAGKSTLVTVLLGLLPGFHGWVRIGDMTVGPRTSRELYEEIGVAFETPRFYPRLTARENLRLFASLYRRSVGPMEPLLHRFGLGEAIDTPVEAYSKGMAMRLGFCRAIMHDPALVVLDEPTAGLDPAAASVIKEAILDLKRNGKTVLMTTHNMEIADQLADRVAFVVAGRVVEVETPRALKLRHGTREVCVEYRPPAGEGGEDRPRHRADATGHPRIGDSVASAKRCFPLDGLGDDDAFIELIRSTFVETIHSREVTLEEVFLAVTGRRLL